MKRKRNSDRPCDRWNCKVKEYIWYSITHREYHWFDIAMQIMCYYTGITTVTDFLYSQIKNGSGGDNDQSWFIYFDNEWLARHPHKFPK